MPGAYRSAAGHAAPGGGAERAAPLAQGAGKPVYTIAHPANASLAAAGAVALPLADLVEAVAGSAAESVDAAGASREADREADG